jgi:hypothetical protein
VSWWDELGDGTFYWLATVGMLLALFWAFFMGAAVISHYC